MHFTDEGFEHSRRRRSPPPHRPLESDRDLNWYRGLVDDDALLTPRRLEAALDRLIEDVLGAVPGGRTAPEPPLMSLFVKASPNEFLVIGRRGRLANRGLAGSAIPWPGSSFARVASSEQEATFAMTQETSDGIPLRFKGIVLYRVVDPAAAAMLFDFASGDGHAAIQDLIAHVCLGELRDTVAHMTMTECIEQRKTTLTQSLERELRARAEREGSAGWGIELDVVQVAQVFIVDDDLRRQLEAGTRDRISAVSERSRIKTQEELHLAEATSERTRQQEDRVTTRESNEIAREKVRLQQALQEEEMEAEYPVHLRRIEGEEVIKRAEIESRSRLQDEELAMERRRNEAAIERVRMEQEVEREKIEAASPVRRLRAEKRSEEVTAERTLRELEREVEAIRVERDLTEDRARQEMLLALLPVQQVSEAARCLADMFQGANVTLYGRDAGPLAGVEPIVDFLAGKVRSAIVGDIADQGPATPAC